MAIVKIYIGPDGSDAQDGTTRAKRVQGRTRLLALIDAVAGGNTVRIMAEGVFHSAITGWSEASFFFDLDVTAHANLAGFRLSSTKTEDNTAPAVEWCPYRQITSAWTDTGTTTDAGTKIWSHAAATGPTRRLWAANWLTDSDYWKHELWEGGANYTTTFTNIHKKLDIVPGRNTFGTCWTCYNAAGSLATSIIYMACPVDPYSLYGTISYVAADNSATMRIKGASNFIVDPEITIRGTNGARAIAIVDCGASGEGLIEAAIIGNHQYSSGYRLEGTCSNITISPYYDPLFFGLVPFYSGSETGHVVGGNHAITVNDPCDMSAATGYWDTPGAVYGLRIKAIASNDRRSLIRDCLHAGFANIPTTGAGRHKFISIDDGVTFDFTNVMYGRALAYVGPTATVTDLRVGAIVVNNQPTHSQVACPRFSVIGAKFRGKKSISNGYTGPWGVTSNKGEIAFGINTYSGTTSDAIDGDIGLCEFECESGGWTVGSDVGVPLTGPVRFWNNVIIRPGQQGHPVYSSTAYQAVYYPLSAAADQDAIEQYNNVVVGYPANCAKLVQTTPALNVLTTVDAVLPAATNSGWVTYTTREEYEDARRAGQVRT